MNISKIKKVVINGKTIVNCSGEDVVLLGTLIPKNNIVISKLIIPKVEKEGSSLKFKNLEVFLDEKDEKDFFFIKKVFKNPIVVFKKLEVNINNKKII